MESFEIIKKPFGAVIQVKHSPSYADFQRLDEWFSNPASLKMPIYIDLGALEAIEKQLFEYISGQLKRLLVLGIPITLVREQSDLRESFQKAGWDRPLMILDYLDEAVFPQETQVRPFLVSGAETKAKSPFCPKCSKEIRPGANRCLHCGQMLFQRRHERHEVSLPFLYGRVANREFLNSNWLGGVTENVDIASFSGVGFFSPREIPRGTEIHLLFPTLNWNKNKEVKSENVITIFTGRVKHITQVDKWYRIGVALFDLFEYTGCFDTHTEVQGDARFV